MHYLLFHEKAPDHLARQNSLQAAHLAHVEGAIRSGDVVLAGSLADPVDGAALLLFQAESPVVAETFAAKDPYVINGIVDRWHVRKWDIISV
jgi:uncharacterized protein